MMFRLPPEAEWAHACMLPRDPAVDEGQASARDYCFGSDRQELDAYAWYAQNSGGTSHPVGAKAPNALGLYDMHGNALV